ncbi:Protein vts1 [Schizosaccharomyces pombe]|uniref:RNA-binding protein vts1 n=1 Tax=Schizosaccharomyces pombe (strain 972 / ATCC 24843) TaxID=284812 RepID=VTS1_SCHPO|nr:putative RNA hairpin-binding protein [Schizosaccharomyces pombe]Q9P6R7.1 RecName: Full=RNA-binding protein vts1 [Schizosaccharomyces pombe 972h-]CAB89878.1 RNA hairpin binding protein (predicted) [Schizosaccharomyces pombe]|eukprot:NP_596258.1 putative RNA hairpin-binding protein [Schizosaccharomyces pombe]
MEVVEGRRKTCLDVVDSPSSRQKQTIAVSLVDGKNYPTRFLNSRTIDKLKQELNTSNLSTGEMSTNETLKNAQEVAGKLLSEENEDSISEHFDEYLGADKPGISFLTRLKTLESWFQSLSLQDRLTTLRTLLHHLPSQEISTLLSSSLTSSPSNSGLSLDKSLPSSPKGDSPSLSSSLPSLTTKSNLSGNLNMVTPASTQGPAFSSKHGFSNALSTASPIPVRTSSVSSTYLTQDREASSKNCLSKALAFSSIEPPASSASTSPRNTPTPSNNGTSINANVTSSLTSNSTGKTSKTTDLLIAASKKSLPSNSTPSKPNTSFFETPHNNIWDSRDRGAFSAPPAPFFPLGFSPHLNDESSRSRWSNISYSPPPPPPPPELLNHSPKSRPLGDKPYLFYRNNQIGPRTRTEGRSSITEGKPFLSSSLRFEHVPSANDLNSVVNARVEKSTGQPSTPLNRQHYFNELPHSTTPVTLPSLIHGSEIDRRRSGFCLNNFNSTPPFQPYHYEIGSGLPQQMHATNTILTNPIDPNSNISTPVGMHLCTLPYTYQPFSSVEKIETPPNNSKNQTYRRSSRGSNKTRKSISHSKNTDKHVGNELPQDIPSWLRSLRLHKYTNNLKDTDWDALVSLSDLDLQNRGIMALGARRKLLKSFQEVAPLVSSKKMNENLKAAKNQSSESLTSFKGHTDSEDLPSGSMSNEISSNSTKQDVSSSSMD